MLWGWRTKGCPRKHWKDKQKVEDPEEDGKMQRTGMLRGCWNTVTGEDQQRLEMFGGGSLKRPRIKLGCRISRRRRRRRLQTIINKPQFKFSRSYKRHITYRECPFYHVPRTRQMAKVKCSRVQALRFCTGRTALRGSRVIALPLLDHGTRSGWGVSVTPRPLFTPVKDPIPIVLEAGWAPGPVWTGAENLAPTGIGSPDRPARSQSQYRLRYSAHQNTAAVTVSWSIGSQHPLRI